MRPDTPLDEVARHLPINAAKSLVHVEETIQTAILRQVRVLVVYWETQRYVFDPVAYEGILDAVVATLIPLYRENIAHRLAGQDLANRLAAAEILIESMTQTMAEMRAANSESFGEEHL